MMILVRKTIFSLLSILAVTQVAAQENGKQKTIDITSTFKPVLREAVKINFSAAPPPADTTKPRLTYNIPNQNLYFMYQPVSLKPMALQVDSTGRWDNSNFVKLGFGNFQTPFVQAGFTFGDGSGNALSILADHVASKGKLPFQQYSQTGLKLNGTKRTIGNQEWNAGVKLQSDQYHRYGFQPNTLVLDKEQDSLRVRYQTIGAEIGFRNIEPTTYGISYHPQLKISAFNDNYKNSESNAILNLPIQKGLGEKVGVDLSFTADLTRYKRHDSVAINNNLFYLSPSVFYKTENVRVNAGIRPSWDNGDFKLLPNIEVEVGTSDKEFTVQAGWTGYFRKTTFESLANFNPWIKRPDSLLNTRIGEIYGGIKGTLGSHFAYGAKLGVMQFTNAALLANDTVTGRTFDYINETRMKALNLAGELSYTQGEAFYVKAGLNMYRYTGLKTQDQPWGLIPTELTGSIRWQPLKDLFLKADLFAWEGANARRKDLSAFKQSGAFDLNAGIEFRITKALNLWLEMNNILNNKYERWNQYEVLGFNVLGGVVFRFDTK
ncbi:MAG: hypothetical protein ACO1NW_18795 [Chitinophagaceae bacterium]